ncbi:hypothetical protein ACL6C3_13510 [Capilliphycus salinus ALCB114379]
MVFIASPMAPNQSRPWKNSGAMKIGMKKNDISEAQIIPLQNHPDDL